MSKSSRRGGKPGSRPSADARQSGGPAGPQSGSAAPGAAASGSGPSSPAAAGRASARPQRPAGARAGRRERARPLAGPSLTERYRVLIVGAVVIAVVAVLAVAAFSSSGAAAYSCSSEFQPGATPAPDGEATGEPGFVEPDMGNGHVALGTSVTYTYCPPATGSHYNLANRGPVEPRVYGPDDDAIPQGWVHNLEHGGLVVLYRGRDGDPGLTDETQEAIRAFAAAMPDSPVCGFPADQYLTVARFDEMATPFAALVWGRILPLDTFDEAVIQDFWATSGEQALTMPERFGCPLPGASPAASPSPG